MDENTTDKADQDQTVDTTTLIAGQDALAGQGAIGTDQTDDDKLGYDKQGRAYAKVSEVKVGSRLALDDAFADTECGLPENSIVVVASDDGGLFFLCGDEGGTQHYLDGQIAGQAGAEFYIGLYVTPDLAQNDALGEGHRGSEAGQGAGPSDQTDADPEQPDPIADRKDPELGDTVYLFERNFDPETHEPVEGYQKPKAGVLVKLVDETGEADIRVGGEDSAPVTSHNVKYGSNGWQDGHNYWRQGHND